MRLQRKFFARDAGAVARELLGKKLARKSPDGTVKSGIITETEAYLGLEDRAAHSFDGRRTKRNEVMYGKAGVAYVYFTYGMHWLLNVVTGEKDNPQAVLLRSLDNVIGPARLTSSLKIDGSFNGEDLVRSNKIWIASGPEGLKARREDIIITSRIGVDYAGEWKDEPLRFLIKSQN